jgi:hypothetical protein
VPATGARIAGRRKSRRSIESSTRTIAGAREDVAATDARAVPSLARREDVLRMDFGRSFLASSLARARGAMKRRAMTGRIRAISSSNGPDKSSGRRRRARERARTRVG